MQKLAIGFIKSTGIIGVLFVMGLFLKYTQLSPFLGDAALFFAVFFAMVYAALGVLGILKKNGF